MYGCEEVFIIDERPSTLLIHVEIFGSGHPVGSPVERTSPSGARSDSVVIEVLKRAQTRQHITRMVSIRVSECNSQC